MKTNSTLISPTARDTNPMPGATTTFRFTPTGVALLLAVGTPQSLSGAVQVLPNIVSCIQAAANIWPNEQLKQWVEVALDMQRSFSAAKSAGNGVPQHFFNQPGQACRTFEQFEKWRSPALSAGPAFEAHALLGRAVVRAAFSNAMISAELMNGLQTLKRSRESDAKGGRSADWSRLESLDLTQKEHLQIVLATLSRKSPPALFIGSCLSVLDTVHQAPESTDRESLATEIPSDAQLSASDVTTDPASDDETTASPHIHQFGTNGAHQDGIPDIGARLAAADWSSFCEKLGIYSRNQMLTGELAVITRNLPRIVKQGNKRDRGFALLATLSLVTGCTDSTALQLRLQPMHSIWLDLDRGSWAWDFNVYRQSKGDVIESGAVDPIFCVWPAFLDESLSAALKANPAAKTLEDLILTIQGTDHFDLKAFRQFLRNAGHPSHPPYRGRYSRTLPAVYLETSGCDMVTAMKSGFFACAAPAALYYFGPTHDELRKQASQVYEKLGFGPPSMRNQETGRTGCKKILEVAALQKGWSDLVLSINEVRQQALTANVSEAIRNYCNQWMELLCTAFVIQTAHRATRLECLTAGALYLHNDVLLIRDKDEGDRAQPRLVPKTASVVQILNSAAECYALMMRFQDGTKGKETALCNATDLVFCQWRSAGERHPKQAIKTGSVEANTRKYFTDSEANFGRSNWVTHLHEDRCNRWLIRALTGHTRDVTRTHGAYFDVPPLVVAARLGLQMELTGRRIFGKAEILSDVSEPPGLRLALFKDRSVQSPAKDRVPDPRTILEPISVDTLVKWCISDRIRNDLVSGRIDAPIEALAVLHLLFIDQIPESDLCISAVIEGGKVIKRYGQRAGLNWNRGHFIHPAWLPIQPTSLRLIEKITKAEISATDLIKKTCTALRKQQYCAWPTSDRSCWAVISSMGLCFRRLSFPPSITAVADQEVPAPCLSALSLSRLAGEKGTPVSRQRPVNAAAYTRQKGDDEKLLTRIIGKYAATTDKLGETIKRAKNCLSELENSQMTWSPFMRWIKDWVVYELKRSREASPGHYKTSSIDTYRAVLVIASELVPPADDPADWEDQDWMAWVWQTDRLCGGKSNSPTVDAENTLTERTKHAVQALVNSLVRRSIYVPSKIHELLGNSIKTLTPRGSASACLISKENLAESRTVLKSWYQDSPGDFALADLRVTAFDMFPARSGDVSSLKTECLTPSGGLVIERAGYNVHKNDNSIRVIPMSEKDALEFQKKKSAIGINFGQHDLLIRYDGSHKAGLRDERIIDDWSLALKKVTGDPLATPPDLHF